MCIEVPIRDSHIDHVLILHIHSQPQHELMVFRDDVSHARTNGIAQAVEELNEAGDVSLW